MSANTTIRRRGRPPIGERAMTNAERKRRRRARGREMLIPHHLVETVQGLLEADRRPVASAPPKGR